MVMEDVSFEREWKYVSSKTMCTEFANENGWNQ